MSPTEAYDVWFLHDSLLLSLLSTTDAADLTAQLPRADDHMSALLRVHLFEEATARYLASNKVAALEILHLRDSVRTGELVWLEQAISFRGVAAALKQVHRSETPARPTFSGKLAADPGMRFHGSFNLDRATTSSAYDQLSGTKRQFMLAYVKEAEASGFELRPLMIAQRLHVPRNSQWSEARDSHVWPGDIDQFAEVDLSERWTHSDLDRLRSWPEKEIKGAFAEIIGEPEIPNDWGGEQFDLWSGRVTREGQPMRAAIAFKGPAAFHPMTIADLGKNGDQIDRLAETPADILVVQHCHAITARVVNMLRVYASDPHRPRHYMTIDGYQTLSILKHFGYLAA